MVLLRSTEIIKEFSCLSFILMFIEEKFPLWKICLWGAVSKTKRISLLLVINIILSLFIFSKLSTLTFFIEYET